MKTWLYVMLASASITTHGGQIIELPKPTGAYQLGSTIYFLKDDARPETHVEHEQAHRELSMQIWYPAVITGRDKKMPFVSDNLMRHITQHAAHKDYFTGTGYVSNGMRVTTHAYKNAQAHREKGPYPVIIVSHGFFAPHYMYTSICQELASHGFVVAALNHTYAADPVELAGGRIAESVPINWQQQELEQESEIWMQDISFLLHELNRINEKDPHNILTSRLDMQRVGIMGHSFGGSIALHVGNNDERIKAIVLLDGVVTCGTRALSRSKKPLMFMYVPTMVMQHTGTDVPEQWKKMPTPEEMKAMDDAFVKRSQEIEQLCTASSDAVAKPCHGMHHMSFTDYFLCAVQGEQREKARHDLAIIKPAIVDFFKNHVELVA